MLYFFRMTRFIKNNIYALLHFCSPSGRDSRQTFCDVYKGSIVLALAGVFICVWRNTIAMLFVRDWLVISELAYWVILVVFELIILLSFTCATIRRWQDLDIRIPNGESLSALISRPHFWAVLASAEGSTETNQYGPAPADNPKCLLEEGDVPAQEVHKQLFAGIDGVEELK